MAEITIPDLCGGSAEIAAIQKEFEALIKSGVDGLEVDASTLSTTIGADVRAVTAELRKAITEKPTLPNINLQSQLASLSRLSPGSFAHVALLAAITLKFGDALKSGGYSIDDLVKVALAALVAGTDLCAEVPNFEVPAAGGEAKEKAVESKQPSKDSEEEKPSTIVENLPWLEEQKENETRVESMQVEEEDTTAEDFVGGSITSTEPPAEDKGAFTVTEKKEEVVYETQKTSVTSPDKQEGKNITTSGFSKEPVHVTENFTLTDGGTTLPGILEKREMVSGEEVDTQKLTLMHKPSKITSIRGYDSDHATPKGRILPIKIYPSTGVIPRGRKRDTYTVSGKNVFIRAQHWQYDGNDKDIVYKISYEFFDNYDPTWTVDE